MTPSDPLVSGRGREAAASFAQPDPWDEMVAMHADEDAELRCPVCWEDADPLDGPCNAWANCPYAEEDQ